MNAPVNVVGRVGTVLRALAASNAVGATTSDVAVRTGLARPTAHRILESLANEGLAERDERTHRWALGPELYLLGRTASARFDVSDLAQPFVQKLAHNTGESAFYSVRRGDETVCLLREDGSFPIRSHVLSEGIRLPLGVGSAGLVILSFLSDREVEEYLARTRHPADLEASHSDEAIRARVSATRKRGWALNDGHIVEGSWGIGAAVFDASGRPSAALSLTGVEHRFGGPRQAEYGKELLDAAHRLTQAMARSIV